MIKIHAESLRNNMSLIKCPRCRNYTGATNSFDGVCKRCSDVMMNIYQESEYKERYDSAWETLEAWVMGQRICLAHSKQNMRSETTVNINGFEFYCPEDCVHLF